ncbi:hypothetical protein [Caldinitratiruptor microaerophilus]|uniref:DUF2642 domain-containing protein n=1 Tax=Caldinitratiruptor microaerophilus TaxID=671077 RepID=A0AA35CIV4_9FIRM|nr:hypothetical protein [Caldinitratiruptor microaerophilus]BDG60030.1 hypothetical protein caldi_11200 [Caldinitratiruptor microaerophilus]
MAVLNIRSLLDHLTGDRVQVFFDQSSQVGRVAALTDDLLVLCTADGQVVWINVADIRAVRRLDDRGRA